MTWVEIRAYCRFRCANERAAEVLDLTSLLEDLNDRTSEKFKYQPRVELKDDIFDVDKLPMGAVWHRLSDVVAVVADMKSSTALEQGRTPASTASIYDAGMGGVASVFETMQADFVDIQGDGAFGLFWGPNLYERAICAGITIRSFSKSFTAQLEKKWPDAPSTGFKVGMGSGSVLAKRVGLPRHLDLQEPVWAGHPVNYGFKASQQQLDPELLVAGSVWDIVQSNDYVAYSCGCTDGTPGGTPSFLWNDVVIEKIPTAERFGMRCGSFWCANHGDEFCKAILEGKTVRDDIPGGERTSLKSLTAGASLEDSAQRERSIAEQQRRTRRESLADEVMKMRLERSRNR